MCNIYCTHCCVQCLAKVNFYDKTFLMLKCDKRAFLVFFFHFFQDKKITRIWALGHISRMKFQIWNKTDAIYCINKYINKKRHIKNMTKFWTNWSFYRIVRAILGANCIVSHCCDEDIVASATECCGFLWIRSLLLKYFIRLLFERNSIEIKLEWKTSIFAVGYLFWFIKMMNFGFFEWNIFSVKWLFFDEISLKLCWLKINCRMWTWAFPFNIGLKSSPQERAN